AGSGTAAWGGAAAGAGCGAGAACLRRPPAGAAAAPSRDRPAATATPGRNPAATCAGVPSCPVAVKTAVTTATPNTPPNRCRVLLTPEALPMSAGGTALSAAVGVAGSAIQVPTPAMMNGKTSSGELPVAVAISAIQANPAACSTSPKTISGRGPVRSASRPASGATTTGVAVQGRNRRPAPSEEKPRPSWKYSAARNAAENSAADWRNPVALAAVKARTRSSRPGSIGSGAPPSQAAQPAGGGAGGGSAGTPSVRAQPASPPRTRPQRMPPAPTVTSTTPGMSNRVAGPRVSGSRITDSTAVASPMGTLTQKIQCQFRPYTTAPPTRGPAATARPAMPPH